MNALTETKPLTINTEPADLMSWVPWVTPELAPPKHLKPLVDALERALLEPVRLIINTPPQHGKSTLIFHWLAKALKEQRRNGLYITYSTDFATSQMRLCKPIAERAGLKFSPNSRALCEWILDNGSTLYATGIGGAITGRPGGLVVVDDPIKDWTEAQSASIRENTYYWLLSSVLTRTHPTSSVIVVQTRWHEDDVSGRLIQDGWEYINLPAINDEGQALWPEQRPIEWLLERRQANEFVFSALYQGQPRPRGNALFGPAVLSTQDPLAASYSIGVDLAYTAKSSADYSVAVIMAKDWHGNVYVVDMVRQQVKAPEFAHVLRALASRYPGAPIRWYCAGIEQGAAEFIIRQGVPLQPIPVSKDKFVRAQPLSAAWNAGRISVPQNAQWTKTMLAELSIFTGVADAHDDIVDAMAAAFDGLPETQQRVEHSSRKRDAAGFGKWY